MTSLFSFIPLFVLSQRHFNRTLPYKSGFYQQSVSGRVTQPLPSPFFFLHFQVRVASDPFPSFSSSFFSLTKDIRPSVPELASRTVTRLRFLPQSFPPFPFRNICRPDRDFFPPFFFSFLPRPENFDFLFFSITLNGMVSLSSPFPLR